MDKSQVNISNWIMARIKSLEEEIENLKALNKQYIDHNALKQLENKKIYSNNERLHYFLLDNMTQGVIYHNCRGQIIFANKAASKILGLPQDQLYGKNSYDKHWCAIKSNGKKMEPEDYPGFITLKTGKGLQNKELKFFIPQINDYKWINVCSIPVFLKNPSRPHQVIVTFEDITHRIASEKEHADKLQLEKKYLLAKESQIFKQNFLANMSHEMRTPLTGILGMSELLIQMKPPPLQKEYLAIIKKSGEDLKEIIDNILDFSKLESGDVTLKKKLFLMDDLVKNLEQFHETNAKEKIEFLIEKDPFLPEKMISDQTKILQVITNLLSNAIKYTDSGKISIRIELEKHKKEKKQIVCCVKVTDTGKGVSEEIKSRLFDPFSNLERNDVRSYEGTGLGLAVCKKLTKMLNGKIGLDSNYTNGSRFWFTFQADLPAENYTEPKKTFQKICLPDRLRVLLVEDKKVNQKVIGVSKKTLIFYVFDKKSSKTRLSKFLNPRSPVKSNGMTDSSVDYLIKAVRCLPRSFLTGELAKTLTTCFTCREL